MDEEVAADENGRFRPLITETLDSAQVRGLKFWMPFVWMDAELGDMPANFRLGKAGSRLGRVPSCLAVPVSLTPLMRLRRGTGRRSQRRTSAR